MDFCQFIDLLKQDNIELEKQEIKAIRRFGEQYHELKQRIQTAKDLKDNSIGFHQNFSNTHEISTSKSCFFNSD
jgi:Tfp pilus assembly protein PilN